MVYERSASTRRTLLTSVVALLCLCAAAMAHAELWTPPEPKPGERDWIQLTSGEWLWGDITLFQDKSLEFDSEELDDLMLDWDDIAVLRSARILSYTFTHQRVATGTASMQKGVLKIRTSDGIEEYVRGDLIKIIEGELSELNFWSAKASLGLTVRSGNTDQADLNTVVKIRRDATRTRIDVDYNGNYSQVDSILTINNTRVGASWNIIIRRGFFVTPFIGELYADEFQNIDLRTAIGAGVGIFIFRRSKLEWNVQLGASYRDTRYVSVEAGQPGSDQTGSIVPATVFEVDLTGNVELDVNYNAQIGVPDPKDSTHHLQALLSVDIFGDIFDLTVNFTWDRIETPVANADGIVPKRDDYRLALGFALDL